MGRRMLLLVKGTLGLWPLIGCTTAYAPVGVTGGYSELQLNERVFAVRFKGNGYTPAHVVQDYLVRRCAELAIESGYSHFMFVDRNATGDTISTVLNLPTRTSVSGSVTGNTFRASAFTTGGPIPITITKHRAEARIYLLSRDEFERLEPQLAALTVDARLVLQQHLGLPVRRSDPRAAGGTADTAQPFPIPAPALPTDWTSETTRTSWALKREGETLHLARTRSPREVRRGEYASCKFEGTELPLRGTCREVYFRWCAHRRTRCQFEGRATINVLRPTRIDGEIDLPHVFECGRCKVSEFPGYAWTLTPAR